MVIAKLIPTKRELKPGWCPRDRCSWPAIAKLIPTKRELKHPLLLDTDLLQGHCKAHPDEKGIETEDAQGIAVRVVEIAKLIPTKRELKLMTTILFIDIYFHCKAHPDEKGIETSSMQ